MLSTALPTLCPCGLCLDDILYSAATMRLFSKLSFFLVMAFLLLTLAPFKVESAMYSASYQINWDSVGSSAEDASSSSTYQLKGNVGSVQGVSTSSSYLEEVGYRAGIYDPTVAYSLFTQDFASQVAATASTSTSVDVTTTSGFAVDDIIVLVQDEGVNQVSAVGKITNIAANTITVDRFDDGGSAPVIDGTNDYVYLLSGTAVPLTTLSPNTISTGIIGWEANADVPEGYSVYIVEDHGLQISGGSTLPGVTDGAVTIGQAEYGARSSDTSLSSSTFDTADTEFTTSPQLVASRSENELGNRDFLTLKAATSSTQQAGAYSQNLTLIFVGSY